jgi:hypothetical protein
MKRRRTFELAFIGELKVRTFLVLIAGAMIVGSCARTTSNSHFSALDVGSSTAMEEPAGQEAKIGKGTATLKYAG